MIEIKGKYSSAKVFTDSLDDLSREQIEKLTNVQFAAKSKIRFMPDVHAGVGCAIGTTMTITDKVVPNLVGVDIGCGMETLIINAKSQAAENFDPVRLDKIINSEIPSGTNVRDRAHEFARLVPLNKIKCPGIKLQRAENSIGTLGGGNHFIEVNRDEQNNLYIVIHSGSRHLGTEVAEYYQKMAQTQIEKNPQAKDVPKELAYVSGKLFDDYINDMKITQMFALQNRKAMMDVIVRGLNLKLENAQFEQFATIHNYIDTDTMILRKGAVSAKKGEKFIVPMNMRDGSIVCEGLGNSDWNCSAPHGAGRIMSRTKAFSVLKLTDFKKAMEGIYSTSVNLKTLDESPMAYKSMGDIIAFIAPTAKILKHIKPIYNFKAAEGKKRSR